MARPYPTRLAQVRIGGEVSQEDLARWTGISRRTIQRLESGEIPDPRIRLLTNLALALGVELGQIMEDEWVSWSVFHPDAAKPPDEDHRKTEARIRSQSPGPNVRSRS